MLRLHICDVVGRRLEWRAFVIVVTYFWLSSAGHGQAAPPDDWQRRFSEEAPQKWQEYLVFTQRLQGRGESIVRDEKGATLLRTVGESKRNADCGLTWAGAANDWELTAFNAAYTFRLQRKSSDAPWVLGGVAERRPGVTNPDMRDTLRAWSGSPMLHLAHMSDLPGLVQQKSFRVLKAAPIQRDGIELVRIDFDNRHDLAETPFFAVHVVRCC